MKTFCGSESEEHHYRIPRAVLSMVSVFIWMEAYQPTPITARKPSSRRPQAKLLCYCNGFLFRPISCSSSPSPDLWEISVRSRLKDMYNVFTMSSQWRWEVFLWEESANFPQSKHQQAQRPTNKRQLINSFHLIHSLWFIGNKEIMCMCHEHMFTWSTSDLSGKLKWYFRLLA